jgi:Protein of unknown function (DUF2568)
VGLGIGAPLVAAVAWGVFVAPEAPATVPGAARLPVEVAVFASATAALYAAGTPRLSPRRWCPSTRFTGFCLSCCGNDYSSNGTERPLENGERALDRTLWRS